MRYQIFQSDGTPIGEAETAQRASDAACAYIGADNLKTAYTVDTLPGNAYPVMVYCTGIPGREWFGCPYATLESAGYPKT